MTTTYQFLCYLIFLLSIQTFKAIQSASFTLNLHSNSISIACCIQRNTFDTLITRKQIKVLFKNKIYACENKLMLYSYTIRSIGNNLDRWCTCCLCVCRFLEGGGLNIEFDRKPDISNFGNSWNKTEDISCDDDVLFSATLRILPVVFNERSKHSRAKDARKYSRL